MEDGVFVAGEGVAIDFHSKTPPNQSYTFEIKRKEVDILLHRGV